MRSVWLALLLSVSLPAAASVAVSSDVPEPTDSGTALEAQAGAETDEEAAAAANEPEDPAALLAQARWQSYLADRYTALSRSERPRDRAMAALLPLEQAWPPREFVLMDAAAAAPDDVVVQWIWAQLGTAPAESCANGGRDLQRAARLRQLDPDNAAVRMLWLEQAWNTDDKPAVDAALADMAAAQRFDIHFLDLLEAGIEGFERYPLPEDLVVPADGALSALPDSARRSSIVHAFAAAQAATLLPSYQSLIQACDAGQELAVAAARRLAVCADIARLMLRAPTLIDRSVGYALLRKSARITAAEAAALARQNEISQQVGRVFAAHDPEASTLFLDAYRSSRDEVTAMEAVLRRFGSLMPAQD